MNNILYKSFSDYDASYIQLIDKNPFNTGQHFKYGTIVEYINKIVESNQNNKSFGIDSILEPGCASCELSAYLSNKYNIKNAFLFDFNIVSGVDIYERQKLLFNSHKAKTNMVFKYGDFFSRILEIPDNSIDLIVDGCSVTHFCGNDSVINSGITSWEKAAAFFNQKLKSKRYVVISTDVKTDIDLENSTGSISEFVYPKDIINIFINNGFEIAFSPIFSNDLILSTQVGLPYDLKVITICFMKR
jgi:SAM-dependent methyltransferase